MLTQGAIEDAIVALSDRLEEITDEYATASDDAAEAEAEYRLRYYRTFLQHKDGVTNGKRGESDETCKGRAIVANEDVLRDYKLTAARAESLRQALYTHQRRLEALRTLAANVRQQT